MLSAPGSWWASAIPTPAYVRACTRNRRAVTYVYVSSQPGVSSNPGFSNLSRFMNGGSSLSPFARHPLSSFLLIVPHFHFPRPAHLSSFPMKWTCSFPSFWIFIVRTRGLNRISLRKPRLSWLLVDLIRIFDWSTRVLHSHRMELYHFTISNLIFV